MSTRKNYRLTKFEVDYINEYALQNNCSETTALKKIIKEHSQESENNATKFLIKEIAEGVSENLYKILTRIRLGTNNADKNSQIIIELLNSIYAFNPDYFIIDKKQQATIQAEDIVKKRIETYRIKRLDKLNGSDE